MNLGDPVRALMSARAGGVSQAPYNACNLGDHVGDDPVAVTHNRGLLAAHMQAEPVWLTQVHGNRVVRLSRTPAPSDPDRVCPTPGAPQPEADGAFTTEPGLACTVMVADCLPVLVEVGANYRVDLTDFAAKLDNADAVMISHMRGHTSDMDRIMALCDAAGVPVINDIGLAALALLVAESDPAHKDTLIRLVMNMLASGPISAFSKPEPLSSQILYRLNAEAKISLRDSGVVRIRRSIFLEGNNLPGLLNTILSSKISIIGPEPLIEKS